MKRKILLSFIAFSVLSAHAMQDSEGTDINEVERIISSTSTDLNSSGNFNDVKLSPSVVAVLDDVFIKKVKGELDAVRNLVIQLSVKLNDLQASLSRQVVTNEVVEAGTPLRNKYLSVNGKAVNSAKADYASRASQADRAKSAENANRANRADRAESSRKADRAEIANRANVASNADKLGGQPVTSFARVGHHHSVSEISGLQNAIGAAGASMLKHSSSPVRNRLNLAVAQSGSAVFVYTGGTSFKAGACLVWSGTGWQGSGWQLKCPSEYVSSVCSGGKQGSCHMEVRSNNSPATFYYL